MLITEITLYGITHKSWGVYFIYGLLEIHGQNQNPILSYHIVAIHFLTILQAYRKDPYIAVM